MTAAFLQVGFCDFLLEQPALWARLRNEILPFKACLMKVAEDDLRKAL